MIKAAKPLEFKGRVQVYTGNGKGKTTAALGLALRAAGHGMKTYIGQFLKGRACGEHAAARLMAPLLRIERFGRSGFVRVTDNIEDDDVKRARAGLEKCRRAMLSGVYRIVVLDEVNTAVNLGILQEHDVLDFLAARPANVEVILTGRYAPASFLRKADLVTEMREKKHYSDKGVKAREGIEK